MSLDHNLMSKNGKLIQQDMCNVKCETCTLPLVSVNNPKSNFNHFSSGFMTC